MARPASVVNSENRYPPRKRSAVELTRKAFRRNSAKRGSTTGQERESDEAAVNELAVNKITSGTSYVESTLYNWPCQRPPLLGHHQLANIQRSQISQPEGDDGEKLDACWPLYNACIAV